MLESALPLLDHARARAEALIDLGRPAEAVALLETETRTRRDWETLRALGRAYDACGRPTSCYFTEFGDCNGCGPNWIRVSCAEH